MGIEKVTIDYDAHHQPPIGSGSSVFKEIGMTQRDLLALAYMFSEAPIPDESNFVKIIEGTLPPQTEVKARR